MKILTLLVALLWFSIAAVNAQTKPLPSCTSSITNYDFGLCDHSTNKMRALPYYTEDCTLATATTENVPKLVSCQATCGTGQFMSPKTDSCQPCAAGSFSEGDEISINSVAAKGSVLWSSRCSPQPCEKWQMLQYVGGGSVTFHSGNQSIGKRTGTTTNPYNQYGGGSTTTSDESVLSVLSIMIQINDPAGGSVRYRYRTESEKYFDGLIIYVNETVKIQENAWFSGANNNEANSFSLTEQNAPFYMTGTWDSYEPDVIFLPYGTTELRFIFRKDASQGQNADFGLDRAFLTDFFIDGLRTGSTWCTPCPAGTYSGEKAGACINCPENTFSAGSNSANCLKCATGSFALPGSSACVVYPFCTADDYVASYSGNCDAVTGKQLLTWKLPPDARCDETTVTAPKDSQVDCLPCPFGGYRDENMVCHFCPPGHAQATNGKGNCIPCAAGTYGQPSARFEQGFEALADGATEFLSKKIFTSECEGECADCSSPTSCTNAFVLTSLQHSDADRTFVAIRSNTLNGDDYHSHLTYVFNTTSDQGATVRISYFFAYADVSPPSELSVIDPDMRVYAFTYDVETWGDSIPFPMTPTGRAGEKQIVIKTDPKKGEFTFELHIHKKTVSPGDRRLALYITKFAVDGDSRGSAAQCYPCPVGHYCPALTIAPTPCPIGTHAGETGLGQCVKCTGTAVATFVGATQCTPCYEGSRANENHTRCEEFCKLQFSNGFTFDFELARSFVFGPAPHWAAYSTMETLDSWNIQRYYLSLCNHVPHNYCALRDGQHVQSSILCQRFNANASWSVGDEREFVWGPNNSLTLSIKGGDVCPRQSNVERSSNVSMVCDPNAVVDPADTSTYGSFVFINENPTCHYNFQLMSPFACRQCQFSDYHMVTSDCSPDGLRTVSMVKKQDSYLGPCSDLNADNKAKLGFSDRVERCIHCNVNDFELHWAACNEATQLQTRFIVQKATASGCFDNGSAREKFASTITEPETRACEGSATSRALPFAVIVAVIIAGSLLCILISLQKKHTQLRQQYETLHSEAYGNQEMGGNPASGDAVQNGKNTGAQEDDGENNNENHGDELERNNQVLNVIDDEAANDVHPAIRHPSPSLVQSGNNPNRSGNRVVNMASASEY